MAQPKGTKRIKPYKFNLPPRKCQFDDCPNEFVPMNSNQHYCRYDHFRQCQVCGSTFKVKNLTQPAVTCSSECRRILARQHTSYDDAWKSKICASNMARRGVLYVTQDPSVIEKRRLNCRRDKGVDSPMQLDEVKTKVAKSIYEAGKARGKYGRYVTKPAIAFAKHFELMNIPIEYEFPIKGYRFDIHIVGTNVLIEIDPTVTHNTYQNPWNTAPDKFYHHRKSQAALDAGFICIHVYDWINIITVINDLQYSKYFSISECDVECHWFNEKTGGHIHAPDVNKHALLSAGYLPVYDDGYAIDFIYKEVS